MWTSTRECEQKLLINWEWNVACYNGGKIFSRVFFAPIHNDDASTFRFHLLEIPTVDVEHKTFCSGLCCPMYMRMFLVIWHVQMAPELFWSLSISNLQTESFTRFNSVSHHRHRPTIECMEKTSDKSKNYFVENFSPNYNYVYGVCAYNMLGGPWQWWCSALVLHDLRFENAMRTQNRCNWKCFRRTKIKYADGTSLCWILNELFVPSVMVWPFDWFVRRPNDAHI